MPRGKSEAIYLGEMKITFAGDPPERYNRAAPEVTAVWVAAVEAAKLILRSHGFGVGRTGYGSRRVDTEEPSA